MNKSIRFLVKIVGLIIFFLIFLVTNKVYADENLKNTTRVYFSSEVTQNSGQRRLYIARKL